jgi:hypothetical protein
MQKALQKLDDKEHLIDGRDVPVEAEVDIFMHVCINKKVEPTIHCHIGFSILGKRINYYFGEVLNAITNLTCV